MTALFLCSLALLGFTLSPGIITVERVWPIIFLSGIARSFLQPARSALGRVASVNAIFIGSSNEIGAFESGTAARLIGTVPSVVLGGLATLVVVAVTAVRVPGLRRLKEIR